MLIFEKGDKIDKRLNIIVNNFPQNIFLYTHNIYYNFLYKYFNYAAIFLLENRKK